MAVLRTVITDDNYTLLIGSAEFLRSLYPVPKPGGTIRDSSAQSTAVLSAEWRQTSKVRGIEKQAWVLESVLP